MLVPTITYLTDIYFGFGVSKSSPELLIKYKISHPLIITDKRLVEMGVISRLGIKNYAVFDNVETNPTEQMALDALDIYRKDGCDGIVAVGGGSPIDVAKCVGISVHHDQPLEQYAIRWGGTSKITSNIPPLIAVPTTAGSGSEVGRAALLTLFRGEKAGFLSKHLVPVAAICDPELTLGLPSQLTAATGMDALSHCLETFCSPRYNPVADAIALDGLVRGYRNISRATFNGTDRGARAEMMMCSLQGGLAFQKSLGAIHSLSHPLGALTSKHLHHGTLNAIFLPIVLQFNFDYCKEKMQIVAERLDISNAKTLPDKFTLLNKELGLPTKLRELGLSKEDLEPLAEEAMLDHCTPTNPRPLTLEDCHDLYLTAW